MTSNDPHSDTDNQVLSADLTDAFDASAAVMAAGITNALCRGLASKLCSSIVRLLMAADEEGPKVPTVQMPYTAANLIRGQPLRLALGEGRVERGNDEVGVAVKGDER